MLKILSFLILLALPAGLRAAAAPDFTVTDSDGNLRRLYADYVSQGKVVVLEIFFTTCPPCATHAPFWQNLYQEMTGQYPGQVEFIMLSDKSADNNAAVAQYKISKGLSMPAAGSNGGSLTAVQPYKDNLFGPFYGTPTFVVIAPGTGELLFDVRGSSPAATMDSIEQKIAQLLLPACRIETHTGDTLQTYGLKLQPPGGAVFTYPVTGGQFTPEQFAGLPAAAFYETTPFKTDNPLNGVSTFDLVQINKNILGIELFTEPWQPVAADANNSGTVTTFDIVELRKLILGVYDSLPHAPSWVFSPPTDTLSALECPEFLAIKKGDVNGNADASNLQSGADRSGQSWPFLLEIPPVRTAGQLCPVFVRTAREGQWLGLQLGLRFNPAELELLSVSAAALPDFSENHWHHTPGRLAVSWLSDRPLEAPAGAVVLLLRFRALRDAAPVLFPEAAPLRAEVYDVAGGQHGVAWQTAVPTASPAVLAPNPARGRVSLWVEDPALLQGAPIRLINLQRQLAYEQPGVWAEGEQAIELRPAGLAPGWYAVCARGQILGKLLWLE